MNQLDISKLLSEATFEYLPNPLGLVGPLDFGILVKFNLIERPFTVKYTYLQAANGINEELFTLLSLDKYKMSLLAYGYRYRDGLWPCFKEYDFKAAERMCNLLRSIEHKWLSCNYSF